MKFFLDLFWLVCLGQNGRSSLKVCPVAGLGSAAVRNGQVRSAGQYQVPSRRNPCLGVAFNRTSTATRLVKEGAVLRVQS